MRLWILMIGLMILGLISPFFAGVVSNTANMYNDPFAQMILWAMLPIFVFIYAFMRLFGDRE